MVKHLAAFCIAGILAATALAAQNDDLSLFQQIDKADSGTAAAPTPTPAQNSPAQPPPTIITATKGSTFDGPTKVAVLFGDVKVDNPQFTLSCDKLTVYFHKDDESAKKDPGTKKPKPTPTPAPKPDAAAPPAQGNIDKVIAEGNVLIQSDRADSNGGPPVHYAGKGDKVIYTPATGEAIISGWPQLQSGINTMVATDNSTVIYLYRDGTMHADGPHKMEIHDPGPDKIPTPGKTPEAK